MAGGLATIFNTTILKGLSSGKVEERCSRGRNFPPSRSLAFFKWEERDGNSGCRKKHSLRVSLFTLVLLLSHYLTETRVELGLWFSRDFSLLWGGKKKTLVFGSFFVAVLEHHD